MARVNYGLEKRRKEQAKKKKKEEKLKNKLAKKRGEAVGSTAEAEEPEGAPEATEPPADI